MKARLIAVLCLTLAVALLASSGISAAPQPPVFPQVNLSEKDNGRQIELDPSQALELSLESNPSTGYGWQVDGMDSKVLRQSGDEFKATSDKVGAPGMQVLRFEGTTKGLTTLKLSYRRPWEKGVKPLKSFSVAVQAKGPYTGVRFAPAYVDENLAPERQSSVTALPAAYNACGAGGCTSVKDQGQCGSCWAFATVGVLENLIKVKNGQTKDLSEQYLVSCNSNGWSCNGGWFAHDYHQWKYITGEPGPGAVYESNFAYKASNVPCNPPHVHNEKIASWAYVGSSSSVPKVAAIKQAIYTYGPVSAAIYVGSAFQAYQSGVFTTNQKGKINHAIVLVGWDDSQGYWILRNSWGSSWGENGYMRIKYGTSSVGYGASYAVYP